MLISRRNAFAVASLILATLPLGSVSAQTAPTREQAHAFLKVALLGATEKGERGYGAITAVEGSECESVFTGKTNSRGYSRKMRLDWGLVKEVSSSDPGNVVTRGGIQRENYKDGSSSELYYGDDGFWSPEDLQWYYFELVIGSKDMADRIQKAMEVIRKSCDRTQGMGF